MADKRAKEPTSQVHRDAQYRQRIESENAAASGQSGKLYTQIETTQGEWHPGKKMIRYEREFFEPYTYPKTKKNQEDKAK